MDIIAKTDAYDNDGNLSAVIKLVRRFVNGKMEYVVDLNFKESVFDDLISALRFYNDSIYSECI